MQHKNNLRQWLAAGEGPTLDFKQHITAPDKIARTLVAFANSRGGRIIVGVEDHGHIIGVDVYEETYELNRAATLYCRPQIELQYEEYETQGKMLLIAHIHESHIKPHYALDKKGNATLYIRVADQCIVAPDFIAAALKQGDLSSLLRQPYFYFQSQNELLQLLQLQKHITIDQYANLKNVSTLAARRTLIDFLFDGTLTLLDDGYTFAASNHQSSGNSYHKSGKIL